MGNNRINFRGNPLEVIGFLDNVTGDLGTWVSDGTPPAGSIPGVIQGRYREACDSWSNGLQWTTALNPSGRRVMSNLCDPWLSSQGSGDPVLDVPYTGGQCPGVQYRIDWYSEFEYPNGFVDSYSGYYVNVMGPIGGIQTRQEGYEQLHFVEDANGTEYSFGSEHNNFPNPNNNHVRYDIDLQVTREDGQPDDCGNLPGEPGPNPNPRPDPGLDPEEEPFVDPTGRPVLPMPEIEDPFGDPVQLPNLPLPNIEGPSLFPEASPAPDPESDPGAPGDPTEIPSGGEAEETAPEGQELVGVKVEFTTVPGKPRQPSNVIGPQLYIGGAYVFLGVDGQGLELQGEGSLIESGQFFFAARPSDKWRVIAALGYAVRVTPYYREVL